MRDRSGSPHTPCPTEAGRGRRWQRLGLAILAVGALAWLWAVDPTQSLFAPRCLFHDLTGLHCPGCGSTRAAHALLHGRLGEALAFNLVFTLGLPLAALVLGWRRLRRGAGRCRPCQGRRCWPGCSCSAC